MNTEREEGKETSEGVMGLDIWRVPKKSRKGFYTVVNILKAAYLTFAFERIVDSKPFCYIFIKSEPVESFFTTAKLNGNFSFLSFQMILFIILLYSCHHLH